MWVGCTVLCTASGTVVRPSRRFCRRGSYRGRGEFAMGSGAALRVPWPVPARYGNGAAS